MEKEFVPYEQALALKELGFDEPCLYCYFPNPNYRMGEKFDLVETNRMLPSQIKNIGELIKDGSFENTILAPLYQQCWRWFREKHNIDITNHLYNTNKGGNTKEYQYEINLSYGKPIKLKPRRYEEAELECLEKLIEIVKEKNE